jgi:hypothetical protein
MRKVTREVVGAFLAHKAKSVRNTVSTGNTLYLFGNRIAWHDSMSDNTIIIATCGWNSVTTRDRLNAIPNVSLSTRKGQLYLNGSLWDGTAKHIDIA